MTVFMDFWNSWSYMFRAVPGGDPYIAAFVLVILVVIGARTLRQAAKYFFYV